MDNIKKTSYSPSELKDINLEYSHDEIIDNLKNDCCEDFVKIFSIINLDNINSQTEAEILFSHLTNHPTPIREAMALKLEEIYKEVFLNKYIKEQFLKSIIDINPNVCRSICAIISKNKPLQTKLIEPLIVKIKELLIEIQENDQILGGFYDNTQKVRKNHAKNKKLFSLYWFLEALSICHDKKHNSEALEIVKKTIKFNDYTIREKSVKILLNIENCPNELLNTAKCDQNFYVKNQVCDKINFED